MSRAFTLLGLLLLPEMREELRRDDATPETGPMVSEATANLEALECRVQILRSMLAALLFRWIGYKGAIKGWERNRLNQYQEAKWWLVDEDTRSIALQRYHAVITDNTLEVWPDFKKPTVPTTGVLATIARSASSLSDKTGGLVDATLQPTPRSSGKRSFEFNLMVAGNPGTQITFFSATESEDGTITISDWDEEEDEVIKDDEQALAFVRRVAGADETREAVERLMILSDQIRQGDRE